MVPRHSWMWFDPNFIPFSLLFWPFHICLMSSAQCKTDSLDYLSNPLGLLFDIFWRRVTKPGINQIEHWLSLLLSENFPFSENEKSCWIKYVCILILTFATIFKKNFNHKISIRQTKNYWVKQKKILRNI